MSPAELLAILLPEAERRSRGIVDDPEGNPHFQAMRSYTRRENIAGVTISRHPKGGWVSDIHFIGLPREMPCVIGSPSDQPFATREAAVEAAVEILALILSLKPTSAPATPQYWFDLRGIWLRVPNAYIDAARPMTHLDDRSPSEIGEDLDRHIAEKCPSGFTEAAFEALDEDQKLRLIVTIMAALFKGMMCWPPREPVASPTHDAHPTRQ